MKTLHRIGLVAIPLTFLLAGIGMLLLLRVERVDGTFFQQIQSREDDWIVSHLLLLASTMFMSPAALALRSTIQKKGPGILGTLMVLLIAPSSMLLAGQYAIDFVVPLMVQTGGDALRVHELLFTTPLVNALFYGLPNVVFLALMLLSIAVVWSRVVPRLPATVLVLNWAAVLLGNLVHPAFQRVAILLLTVSFMPLVVKTWRQREESADTST